MAQEVLVHDKEFCPVVLWPVVTIWELQVPKVDLKLLEIREQNREANMAHEFQCHVIEKYKDHLLIFTDA